jgi:hypothetical protein
MPHSAAALRRYHQVASGHEGGGTVGVATALEALRLLHMNMIKTCTQLCSQIPSIAMEPVSAPASNPRTFEFLSSSSGI